MVKEKVNKKVLLVQSPPWGVYSPPLGIAYLVTFLKSYGFPVEALDLNIEMFQQTKEEETKEKWTTQNFDFWASGKAVCRFQHRLEEFANRIISHNAQIIGFSVTRASAPFLNAIIPIIRKKTRDDVMIVLGGAGTSHVEIRPLFRKDLIDYFVIGEGEYLLLCFLRDLQEGRQIQTSRHYAIWKDAPEDRAACLAASIDGIDINDIPFPDFEEFDLSLYTQGDLIPLISSRGCIRSCAFCCDSPLKKPYRSRNPEKIAEEIRHHVARYNRKRFEFSDLLINGDLRSLDRLCDILIKSGLEIGWGGQATVRPDMTSGIFKKLKKAGCGSLTLGCESFSDRVLKLMRKGTTARDARETLVKAKDAGLLTEINIIVGFPGENESDFGETVKFLKENAGMIHNINSLNICNIEPGMHIYERLEEYGIDTASLNDRHAWFNKDMSNTLKIRLDRHKRLMSVCAGLGLNPRWHNAQR